MINADGTKTWDMKWAYRDDPVFEVILDVMIDYPNGDKLPGIWITEPIFNDEGGSDGRTYVMAYPYADHEHPFPGDDDEDGNDALFYGGGYYDEGMSYTDPANHEKRIECFQAAELLYRHAAGRGNAVASLCLGYVYSYDRCEGRYWRDPMTLETEEDYRRPTLVRSGRSSASARRPRPTSPRRVTSWATCTSAAQDASRMRLRRFAGTFGLLSLRRASDR